MIGLEKYKNDKLKELENIDINRATNDIWHTINKCKYCKYHISKFCVKEDYCWEGIYKYLEEEIV